MKTWQRNLQNTPSCKQSTKGDTRRHARTHPSSRIKSSKPHPKNRQSTRKSLHPINPLVETRRRLSSSPPPSLPLPHRRAASVVFAHAFVRRGSRPPLTVGCRPAWYSPFAGSHAPNRTPCQCHVFTDASFLSPCSGGRSRLGYRRPPSRSSWRTRAAAPGSSAASCGVASWSPKASWGRSVSFLLISRCIRRGEVDPMGGFVAFACLLLVLLLAFCWINISGTILMGSAGEFYRSR